jgi:hypothetical protein
MLSLSLFAFVAIFLWLLVFQLIDELPGIAMSAFVMSIFGVATVAGVLWAWVHFHRKISLKRDTNAETCHERAGHIARIAKVPIVIMGHTHRVDYQRLDGGAAVYANAGTWTSVNNPWNRIMRDARRLTFIQVTGGHAKLARWNDDAGRVDDVPLFYLETGDTPILESDDPLLSQYRDSRHSLLPSAAISGDTENDGLNGPDE